MARKQARPIENGQPVATAGPEAEVVWKGNDLLRDFLVPIKNLREDPKNANTHPDRSIEAIASSYLRFGQAKPIICGKDGTVKDGNGQLVAAAGLGWTHIAVIPSDLDGHELQAYSLAVNRSGELAEWNFEELARQLRELEGYGAETSDLGWDPEELTELLNVSREATDNGQSATESGSPAVVMQNFGDFNGTAPDDGYVAFRFGDYGGRVSKSVYESFVASYKEHQAESGEPMMDDVMRAWLDV